MRLCTVYTEKIPEFFGIELGRKVLRVAQAARAFGFKEDEIARLSSCLAYFQNLPRTEKTVRTLLKRISEEPRTLARPAEDGHPCFVDAALVRHRPPISNPGKFLCIGLNYKDHCEEQNKPIPKKPLVFNKFTTSLIGHGDDIHLPHKYDKCIDYEAELGVVIGKRARRVTKRTAMKHVGGYTIVNDVSARTIQNEERQWSRAKGFDSSGPFGPVIATPDEVPDPHALDISCVLNGKTMQKSSTREFIFDIPYLISFITQMITLEPGDIISTGTPGGVGVYRSPQVFLKEGDVVEIRIGRLGSLRNKCVKG